MKIILTCGFIFAAVLTGCVTGDETKQLIHLKRLSDNRAGMDRYITVQETGFARLQDDFKGHRLIVGTSKGSIISRYAEPVYCKANGGQADGEICLYRRPTEFFSPNAIFLYFDRNGQLESWESLADENTKRGGQ